jgi:ABC-type oligopeptide transport system substrate-binding subunit
MKKILLAISFLVLVFGLAACGSDPSVPSISGTGNVTIEVGDSFDPLAGVSAADDTDGNLTADISVSGSVNAAVAGTYTLTYSVTNSAGESVSRTRTVTVREPAGEDLGDFVLANGTYDFKFAPVEVKNDIFAAAEAWMLQNQIGGIPLYASSSYTLFSPRIQLPTDTFNTVMGFGTLLGTMSEDDSQVLMDNGRPGNVGEFTYRSRLSGTPDTLFHWEYQDSISSDVITLFLDSLYYYNYDDSFEGFEIFPSMASGMPSPIDAQEVFGNLVSNTWSIPVRSGLRWTYHPDTDTSDFPEGHELITADSFVDTFKLAIDNGWFRAISGGGDFLSAAQRIKNVQEYIDGDVEWEEVGFRTDGNNIVIEFVPLMSEWNVKSWLGSFVLNPINFALYDAVGDLYGTSAETTAYNGRFVITTYEPDRIIRYRENPNFHDPNRTSFTGIVYEIIEDPEIAFQQFLSGRLDATGLTAARFDEFQTFPGIRFAPGASVFRMNINASGTVEAQREQFPNGTWEPEPILAYPEFLRALYLAIDRKTVAEDVMRTAQPAMWYFSPAYFVDPEGGVPFRSTEQGDRALEGLSPSTFGYNPDAAVSLFRSAVREAVANGDYSQNQVISLLLGTDQNPGSALAANFIKEELEQMFVDPETGISVELSIQVDTFPNNYFNVILPGEFDLGFGAIAGSTLNASSFLNIFRSGPGNSPFVLNFGPLFDTEEANIRIEFPDPDTGELRREIFSLSAIYYMLLGEVEVEDGMVVYD